MRSSMVFIAAALFLTVLSGCGIKPKQLAAPGEDINAKKPSHVKTPEEYPRVYPDPTL